MIFIKNKTTFYFIFFYLTLLINNHLQSQNYSYRDYLNDETLKNKFNFYLKFNRIDSLKLKINCLKNKLGFTYYKFHAIISDSFSDSIRKKYLDTAFMKGMTPLCLDKLVTLFDSNYVNTSFKKNYLKSYDLNLINTIDSMNYEDQKYRQQIALVYEKQKYKTLKDIKNDVGISKNLIIDKPDKKRIDSLWQLQKIIDSSNIKKIHEIIIKNGWPSAKKIGDYYCQRPAPDIFIFFRHMGNTRRDYQLFYLKKVFELCKKQEESWGNAEYFLSGFYLKFANDFSEFNFLTIKNNKIDLEKSYFAIKVMADLIMKSPLSKVELKCNNFSLYQELVSALISMNKEILLDEYIRDYKKTGLPIPEGLKNDDFIYTKNKNVDNDIIFYKIIKK